MKQVSTIKITITALCAVINIVGAYIALALRLPVYLDSIGTVLNSVLFGPVFGMWTACLSGIFSGVTSDVYSFYFIPVGMIIGTGNNCQFLHYRIHIRRRNFFRYFYSGADSTSYGVEYGGQFLYRANSVGLSGPVNNGYNCQRPIVAPWRAVKGTVERGKIKWSAIT